MTTTEERLRQALERFAKTVKKKLGTFVKGEPEDQLRAPFERLMDDVGDELGIAVVATGETHLPDRLGRPDYAVHAKDLLAGYVELKAPGKGANPKKFKTHDREQWDRFKSLPNLIYTDGTEWGLFRSGKPTRPILQLEGDVATEGEKAIGAGDVDRLRAILTDFLSWEPSIPPKMKPKQLAELLAPLCRLLREDVAEGLKHKTSPLLVLRDDWRRWLFPQATDDQFADAYAQTVTFALLLARSEGAHTLKLNEAVEKLAARHSLLSRALQVLTDTQVRAEIGASLDLLQRVIDCVPTGAMAGDKGDPWLYFYEDFLAAYDAKLRKNAGVYYTPVQVVRAQVRLIDSLLTTQLGRPYGFADESVVTLDPAVGTGTYLVGVIDHALKRIETNEGAGAVPARARRLADNLVGFENLVGPYAVCELRITRALKGRGAELKKDHPRVYLTDTLESPFAEPPEPPLFAADIAEQHKRALRVKDKVPVIVCLGNPPYGRHKKADAANKAASGGWVRWGDKGDGIGAIFDAFRKPAMDAGHGGDLKNAYNLYVYFWRWALWKVFEHKTASGPGIVSFITASSYLEGDAFVGMREQLRRYCDSVWIIDLGGEGRGTRKTDNVFSIKTPVAIAIAYRSGNPDAASPAAVRFARIEGDTEQKLGRLDSLKDFSDLAWDECPSGWHAPFRPAGKGDYFALPLLLDLMPWQQSGVKVGRSWPLAPDNATLVRRWAALCAAAPAARASLFVETPTGRKLHDRPKQLPPASGRLEPIQDLEDDAPFLGSVTYALRSFDRHRIAADARLIDRPGPPLWRSHGENQLYLTTLLNHPLGSGPAVVACAAIPDLHHFRGSYGAKEVIPLFRDPATTAPNVAPALLERWSAALGVPVTAPDFAAYTYAVLANSAFTSRFRVELETRELRVPLTKTHALFAQAVAIGSRLLWLHTYGERFFSVDKPAAEVPTGGAKSIKPVSDDPASYPEEFSYDEASRTLHVGDGSFSPVSAGVWSFEVSGLQVVSAWLGQRMAKRKGKKSSPLDDIHPERWTAEFTTELLKLLWIIEHTLKLAPAQAKLLDDVLKDPLLLADELPPPPPKMRSGPAEPEPSDNLSLF